MHNPTLRVTEVLNLLCKNNVPMRLSDIGRELNIPKSTLLPILQTLVKCGYIGKDASERYFPGFALIALGKAAGAAYGPSDFIQENLRKVRITLDELTAKLRLKDVLDLTTVQYAILETDGSLSVFPFPKHLPATARDAGIQASKQHLPVTIIEDGFFSRENLQKSGKDEAWLKNQLASRHTDRESTFLLTVDGSGRVNWVGQEGSS